MRKSFFKLILMILCQSSIIKPATLKEFLSTPGIFEFLKCPHEIKRHKADLEGLKYGWYKTDSRYNQSSLCLYKFDTFIFPEESFFHAYIMCQDGCSRITGPGDRFSRAFCDEHFSHFQKHFSLEENPAHKTLIEMILEAFHPISQMQTTFQF